MTVQFDVWEYYRARAEEQRREKIVWLEGDGRDDEYIEALVAAREEVDEIHNIFLGLLAKASGDGQVKRASGKPHWKVDPGHEAGLFSHLTKWSKGELTDPDSGTHPLVHAAWRCLAIAYQEGARP